MGTLANAKILIFLHWTSPNSLFPMRAVKLCAIVISVGFSIALGANNMNLIRFVLTCQLHVFSICIIVIPVIGRTVAMMKSAIATFAKIFHLGVIIK